MVNTILDNKHLTHMSFDNRYVHYIGQWLTLSKIHHGNVICSFLLDIKCIIWTQYTDYNRQTHTQKWTSAYYPTRTQIIGIESVRVWQNGFLLTSFVEGITTGAVLMLCQEFICLTVCGQMFVSPTASQRCRMQSQNVTGV